MTLFFMGRENFKIKKPAVFINNRLEPPFEFKIYYESTLRVGLGLESSDTRSITIEIKNMV